MRFVPFWLSTACLLLMLMIMPARAEEPLPDPFDKPEVNTLREIGPALYACWSPPAYTQNYQVTVIFSLKRSGEILGKPKITFSKFNGDTEEQKQILQSILQALDECTPLRVTPALGAAIAGRIFTMTFEPRSYKG